MNIFFRETFLSEMCFSVVYIGRNRKSYNRVVRAHHYENSTTLQGVINENKPKFPRIFHTVETRTRRKRACTYEGARSTNDNTIHDYHRATAAVRFGATAKPSVVGALRRRPLREPESLGGAADFSANSLVSPRYHRRDIRISPDTRARRLKHCTVTRFIRFSLRRTQCRVNAAPEQNIFAVLPL